MSAPQPGTPLPWFWQGGTAITRNGRYIHVENIRPLRVASANAAYIVHACNNHPKAQALADALRDMLEMRELHFRDRGHPKGEMQVVAESRAALAAWDAKP